MGVNDIEDVLKMYLHEKSEDWCRIGYEWDIQNNKKNRSKHSVAVHCALRHAFYLLPDSSPCPRGRMIEFLSRKVFHKY